MKKRGPLVIPAGAALHAFPDGKAPGPYTHWFTDPSDGHPVLVRLAETHPVDLDRDLAGWIAQAFESSQWLITVSWLHTDGGKLVVQTEEKHENFPRSDYRTVIRHVTDSLTQEATESARGGKPAKPEPAGHLEPVAGDIFGGGAPAPQVIRRGVVEVPQAAPAGIAPAEASGVLQSNEAPSEAEHLPGVPEEARKLGMRWPTAAELAGALDVSEAEALVALQMMKAGKISPRFFDTAAGSVAAEVKG